MVVVGEDGLVILAAGPLICDHTPVPTVAALAAILTLVPHFTWSGPAFATVALSYMLTCTLSEFEGQIPLPIVQLNIYVPAINPDIPVFGKAGFAITAVFGPLICVHWPMPDIAVFPASVAAVVAQRD